LTPRISPERLTSGLAALARIGGRPDGGVDRLAGTPADVEARNWLAARMTEAGLVAGLDEVNNVFGHPASPGPWLLLGSHTDTVPAGGRLDGAYGVMAALEVCQALAAAGHPAAGQVAVVSFHDEEGVTGHGFEGSEHFCASPAIGSISGYLELHIEQGPRLEAEGLDLGVVDAIVGIDRYDVVVHGQANHAGTTPFNYRHDAGRAAARFIGGLRELVQGVDERMVANVGSLQLEPGAPNVVPGVARFVAEVRCPEPAAPQIPPLPSASTPIPMAEVPGTIVTRPVERAAAFRTAWTSQPRCWDVTPASRSGFPITARVPGHKLTLAVTYGAHFHILFRR